MCLAEDAVQAYVDGEMEPAQRDDLTRHVAGCERCRARVTAAAGRHARVDAMLRHLAAGADAQPTTGALARFRARVAAADGPAGGRTRPALPFRTSPALGALATTVSLALILCAVYLFRPSPPARPAREAPGRQAGAASGGATPRVAPLPAAAVGTPPISRAPAPVRGIRSHGPRLLPRATDEYYLVTEDATPVEMGMVVRVRMRLSALTRGAVVESHAAAEPEVEADVLVGEDGRARAVRFVNQTQTTGGK